MRGATLLEIKLRERTFSKRVSLESRYGACAVAELARALMHMPSMVRLMLMLLASSARSPAEHNRGSHAQHSTAQHRPECAYSAADHPHQLQIMFMSSN
jgi:hypothetical protein